MDDNKFRLGIWIVTVAGIVLLNVTWASFWNFRTRSFIYGGYTRSTLLGAESPQWILPEETVKLKRMR